jgi:hypothetical protein
MNARSSVVIRCCAIGIERKALRIVRPTDSTRHVSPIVMTPLKSLEPLTTNLSASLGQIVERGLGALFMGKPRNPPDKRRKLWGSSIAAQE